MMQIAAYDNPIDTLLYCILPVKWDPGKIVKDNFWKVETLISTTF